MALHWRPVGPEPAQTYWQRRVAAAGVALVVLLVLSTLGARVVGGQGDAGPLAGAATASSAATPRSAPQPSSAPSPSARDGTCLPSALKVGATVASPTYPVGGRPRLSLTIENTGSQACEQDLGQAALELLVYSGSDRIWSSDDCAPGGPEAPETLAPGTPRRISLAWAGTRSQPGCTGSQERVKPGTYVVRARVGEQRASGASFRVTA